MLARVPGRRIIGKQIRPRCARLLARAPWRRAIGKLLLAGALRRSVCREAALRRRGCAEELPLRERTVRRILFAGFEALCVFGYLELVYHLLNLTIHKDRQVVG